MSRPVCIAGTCTRDAVEDGLCAVHAAAERFPTIARTLSPEESAQRQRERVTSTGRTIVTLCSEAGCARAASNGPWCGEHRPLITEPRTVVARDLSEDEYAALRAQVEADAAPLFVIAMKWIAGQQLAQLGATVDSLEASITRIRGELASSETEP